ncbi:DUF1295 domain-containing protein [Candidatus Saccharibacteria bacterium]|nr:DUF1295 domain-containing protein [Candidatus Saccharibacteria bacterium]
MLQFAFSVIFVYMSVWFVISRILNRNDVADTAWGIGFVVLAWALYITRPSVQLSLAVILITIWGIRLSVHVFLRNRGKPEDFRYVQWRKQWGRWYLPRSFLQVFMLQGFLLVCISAPVVLLGSNGRDSINPVNSMGVLIWLVGFMFEAVGDLQLGEFVRGKKQPGEILQTGLWRYTRHPNYFGEVLQWWGIWLIAFGAPGFMYAVVGPLTITFLILKVSGVPLLEKKYAHNKAYQKYAAKTSKFIPLPPK